MNVRTGLYGEFMASPTEIDSKNASTGPLPREELYALVWAKPMLRVGEQFGVSSSYLARVCKRLNVPRPERGYWARLAVGRAPSKPDLPEAGPGDELSWVRNGEYDNLARPLPRPRTPRRRSTRSSVISGQHPLIEGAKLHFEKGRYKTDSGYLKPDKKNLVDLFLTRESLDKGLALADALFSHFEKKGHRVMLAPRDEDFRRAAFEEREGCRGSRGYRDFWSPWRCTVVYIGTLAIGLTIFELSKETTVRYVDGKYVREDDYVAPPRRKYTDHSWTTTMYWPTGRLCLQAYSPYPRAKWINQWRETEKKDLTSRIKLITRELKKASFEIAKLVEQGEIQAEIERKRWEAQREQWRKEEEERRAAKALTESRTELFNIIAKWAEANRIEQFFREAEHKISELGENDRLYLMDRLDHARQMIGSINPLDYFKRWKSPDEILKTRPKYY